jgi:5-methylcytosine-specific restriction endonuclease McrBC GTP-binding regulatory subunit McrB
MSKYFLYAQPLPESLDELQTQDLLISKDSWREESSEPAKGDKVLLVSGKGGGLEYIQPLLLAFQNKNKDNYSFILERTCLNPVPMEIVRAILSRPLTMGANAISAKEYEEIVTLMGGTRVSENELLEHIKKYIAARGYYFPEETIYNYHICLKTRPFVILAGLSGTGKSKLSQLYAEAIGHSVQNGHYLRLAVRPSWNDDRFLLGYLNTITGEYVTEPAIEFVIQAERDRDNLYFLCLDEMNLAHIEYYFSQFLSALEEENPADRRIHLFSQITQSRLESQGRQIDVDRVALVPVNLLFTGTINVDETTQQISDKVIDRANTLEFFDVDLAKLPDRQPAPEPMQISASTWRSFQVSKPDPSCRSDVIEISKILSKSGLGLGYRVLREIELYMANSKGLLAPSVAFDLQVKQRILPRLRGTQAILNTLRELQTFTKQQKLSRSLERLEEMESRLKRDGYTSFWR